MESGKRPVLGDDIKAGTGVVNSTAEAWARDHDHIKYVPVISDGLPEDNWTGHKGFIHQVLLDNYLKNHPSPEDCDSVEKQIERCRAYAAGHGYTVVAEHEDKDLSGGRADNRPGLQNAIAVACARQAVLVVYSLSRLARCNSTSTPSE